MAADQGRDGGNGEGRTNPNLGEDALLLEGAGDERLELHHLPRVVVHPCLPGVVGGGGGVGGGARARAGSLSSPLLSSLAPRPEGGETENGDRSSSSTRPEGWGDTRQKDDRWAQNVRLSL